MNSEITTAKCPIHLIVQYYRAATLERQEEVDTCLRENLLNPLIEAVHLLTEDHCDLTAFPNQDKIRQAVIGERLTYERAFRYANDWPDKVIWILANADIYFDDTLRLLPDVDFNNLIFALTRHNVMPDGTLELMPMKYAHGSQDAWIFTTPVPVEKMFTSFFLGIPGCDNRITYEFVLARYQIINPCHAIRIMHLDLCRAEKIEKRVDDYFQMTTPENVKAGRVAPPPYLGEIYPTQYLTTSRGIPWDHHLAVLADFAEHVRYINGLQHELTDLKDHFKKAIAAKELQIEGVEQQVAALQNSLSWRITEPLRNVAMTLFPRDSKQQLVASILFHIVTQPRKFAGYLNRANVKTFIRYLLHGQLRALVEIVNQSMEQSSGSQSEVRFNTHLLYLAQQVEARNAQRVESVDVIVPVYNGFDVTSACLDSVLANSKNCRLIIIDDASTDGRISSLLSDIHSVPEREIEIVILRNERNLGFVQSVNRACKQTEHHFVILNSDTEVPPGWLDRLFAPIFANPDLIASVTPFSNAGMACSFPRPDNDNPIYRGLSVTELDNFFMRFGSDEPIEIFTGVGFCMAFNKEVVARIGMFDAETFGKGYGEECDWSLRAFDAGFRNVIIPNLFVYHKHGGSFAKEEKQKLLSVNLEKFWAKHPNHKSRHANFAISNALRDIREAVSALVDLSTSARRVAILDVDMVGGGTFYSSNLTLHLQSRGYAVIHFKYNIKSVYLKIVVRRDGEDKTYYLESSAAENISAIIKLFSVEHLLVNELFSWPDPKKVIESIRSVDIPYQVFMHDFFMLCPSWFLINGQGDFCQLPEDKEICMACLSNNDYSGHRSAYGDNLNDRESWCSVVASFLASANQIVCFSSSTMDYLQKTYPQLSQIVVSEHFIPGKEFFSWKHHKFDGVGPLKIGIIGNLYHIKGERIVRELVERPEFQHMPVTLSIFGEAPLYLEGYKTGGRKVTINGKYQREHLQSLLEQEGIHLILIASILAETFSYTTSEAMLMGYPIICFDLGAPAERVKRYGAGIVLSDISLQGIIKAFQKIIDNPALVAELSEKTKQYVPVTEEEHFKPIIKVI